MSVDFLTTEQKDSYGQFNGEPNDVQLARYFHLDEFDLDLIQKKRGKHNRLGFALQLTSIRFLGVFILDFNRIPFSVSHYVARQLGISNVKILARYALRKNTQWEHNREIKKIYGYRELSDGSLGFCLIGVRLEKGKYPTFRTWNRSYGRDLIF